jgi:hypothetical protein
MQIGVICVRATREPALLTSARLVAPDDQGGDSCSVSSAADPEASGSAWRWTISSRRAPGGRRW